MKDYLGRQSGPIPDAVRQTAKEIAVLEHAKDTADIINKIEEIYNTIVDTKFEEQHGNLETVLRVPPNALASAAWQECLTDEQMEEILKKYLASLGKDMMSLQIRDKQPKKRTHPTESLR